MRFYLFTLLFICSSQNIFCQIFDESKKDTFSFIVDSIKISGNDITEEFIIQRELTFEIGDTLNQHDIDYNEERIFSLGIFNKVELKSQIENELNILNIKVEESWYIYPIPFAQLKDKDWDKLSYGLYVIIKNFRGRNETLSGSAAFGYDPSFSVSYFKPSIIFKSDIYFSANVSYRTVSNRSETAEILYGDEFNYTYITYDVSLGNRFGLYHRAGIDFGFNYVESPKFFPVINASNERIDRFLRIGLTYSYDTRDLFQFPKEGELASFNVQFKGLGINSVDYRIYRIDLRAYRKLIGNLCGKIRFTSRQTEGKLVPFYDYSYLGFDEAVRGYYGYDREGHNYYLGSVELFHPVIEDITVSLDFIPLLPKELLTFRLGLYAELFGDIGATQFRGDPVSINDFDKGYGAGLSLLLLPYNVLRFEMGVDANQKSQFIFDLAVSF